MRAPGFHPFDVILAALAGRLDGLEPSPELRAMFIVENAAWKAVVWHASEQFVLAAFAAAVRDLGLDHLLEPELRDFLAAVYAANRDRNQRLRRQLVEAATALNRIDIEPVLLKGAIRLVDGLYPERAWRMMRDLDLLVPDQRFEDALRVLRQEGYVARVDGRRAKDVKLRHPGRAPIELHQELFTAGRTAPLRALDLLEGSKRTSLDGARARLPAIEHQLAHLIGHSQIGHFNYIYGRVALSDRLEAAALLRRSPEGPQWERLRALFTRAGQRRVLFTFLWSLGDGRLWTPPCGFDRDPVTVLQAGRIRRQARSRTLTRLSLWIGWCVVLLKMQLRRGDAGRPQILATLRDLRSNRARRRRILQTFVHGLPRPW